MTRAIAAGTASWYGHWPNLSQNASSGFSRKNITRDKEFISFMILSRVSAYKRLILMINEISKSVTEI
jgi:hypothetical protein